MKPCSGCRKRAYSSYAVADKVRHRSNVRNRGDGDDGSVYWCPTAGGWHVTSWDRGDFDRVASARRREATRHGVMDGWPSNDPDVELPDTVENRLDLAASPLAQPGPHHRDDERDVAGVADGPVVGRLVVRQPGPVRPAEGAAPADDPVEFLEDVAVGHLDAEPGVVVAADRQDVAGAFPLVDARDPGPGCIGHRDLPDSSGGGYPPQWIKVVDNRRRAVDAKVDPAESVDYVGASPATSAPGRVGILPVGPAVGQDPEGQKIGGPSRAWEDRPTPPTRHNLAWEPAVTLPDAARGDAQLDADTPTVPTPVDDARPWDGWDDEYEYAS